MDRDGFLASNDGGETMETATTAIEGTRFCVSPWADINQELDDLRDAWALAIETSPVDYCAEVRPWS